MDSIDESSTENDSGYGSISTNVLGDIWDGSQIYPKVNSRDSRLKTNYRIRQTKDEWKCAEL